MRYDFSIKKGDRLPALRCRLTSGGATQNLTGATQVRFLMRLPGAATTKVAAAATITDAAGGIVEYAWAAGDTDTEGVYDGEFEVTWPGPKLETFPGNGHLSIAVIRELG